ncbi:YegP family protein [Embleya hyalina]|uniref:DUF1508 domain-containing protein n=1 Tax=Embleya hyalina TaxID=516124 RepID=A0A401YZ93_9ACTN|nr:YegP family protein [Embleya hyalina]GCD99911.1 hypothetical protein EHYA_07635 [Embleya hyalina]
MFPWRRKLSLLSQGDVVPAKFIVTKGRSGKFGFVLTAANGSTVIKSAPYETKREALTALRYIQRNGDTETVDDRTVDTTAARASAAVVRKRPVSKPVASRPRKAVSGTRKAVSSPRKAASQRRAVSKTAGSRPRKAVSRTATSRPRKAVSRTATSRPRKAVARTTTSRTRTTARSRA